jgi:hypothetical protein
MKHCKLHPALRELKKELSKTIRVEHPEPKS